MTKPPLRYVDEDSQAFRKNSAKKKVGRRKTLKEMRENDSTYNYRPKKLSKEEKAQIKARVRSTFDNGKAVMKDIELNGGFFTDDITELTDAFTNATSERSSRSWFVHKPTMYRYLLVIVLLSIMWPIFANIATEIPLALLHLCISIVFAVAGCWAKFAIIAIVGLSHFISELIRSVGGFIWSQEKWL